MAVDRYSRDYRLVETVDEKGRIHTDTEYIGAHYRFARGLPEVRTAARKMAACCLLGWLGFLAALYLPSIAMKRLYAALPCAFSALPLWFLSSAVWTGLRAGEKLSRREAERVNSRLPAAALFLMLLPAAACLGALAALLPAGASPLPGDWAFFGGCLLCVLCGLFCFMGRRAVAAEQI